jgi:hypothetical protein
MITKSPPENLMSAGELYLSIQVQLSAAEWGGDLPEQWVAYRHFRAAYWAQPPLDR